VKPYGIVLTLWRIISTITIRIEETSPNLPISYAIASNFIYKGVASGSSDYSRAYILPTHDASPTTIINILPSPESTLVPLINMGDATSCLPAVFLAPSSIIEFL